MRHSVLSFVLDLFPVADALSQPQEDVRN